MNDEQVNVLRDLCCKIVLQDERLSPHCKVVYVVMIKGARGTDGLVENVPFYRLERECGLNEVDVKCAIFELATELVIEIIEIQGGSFTAKVFPEWVLCDE